MLKYFLVKIPGYLFFAIPLGILMGGMLSLLILRATFGNYCDAGQRD